MCLCPKRTVGLLSTLCILRDSQIKDHIDASFTQMFCEQELLVQTGLMSVLRRACHCCTKFSNKAEYELGMLTVMVTAAIRSPEQKQVLQSRRSCGVSWYAVLRTYQRGPVKENQ